MRAAWMPKQLQVTLEPFEAAVLERFLLRAQEEGYLSGEAEDELVAALADSLHDGDSVLA